MLEKVRFNVIFDKLYYLPGQIIEGQVVCDSNHQDIEIDSLEGRLHGEALFHFPMGTESSSKPRVLVDETFELWRHCTLSQMLGLDVLYDENQNKENASTPSSSTVSGPTIFPIRLRVPLSVPPTFHCPGSPITIRYFLEISMKSSNMTIAKHEEPVVVLEYPTSRTQIVSKPLSFTKTFNFPKDRSIFVEFLVKSDVLTTTDRIDACINISNRWKQSLKYVHMNIIRRISALNEKGHVLESVNIDTTGVGLPSEKLKIACGESFSFRPSFNVPALPPNTFVPGLMRADYFLKLTVGRAHNFVLGSMEIPITIVTNVVEDRKHCRDEMLIDISPSATISSKQFDLLFA